MFKAYIFSQHMKSCSQSWLLSFLALRNVVNICVGYSYISDVDPRGAKQTSAHGDPHTRKSVSFRTHRV